MLRQQKTIKVIFRLFGKHTAIFGKNETKNGKMLVNSHNKNLLCGEAEKGHEFDN